MSKRTFPNTNFAWFNDDDRLAIVCDDLGGSYCSLSAYNNKADCEANGGTWNVAGNTVKEKYDTYQGGDVTNGIRLTFHSKYEETTATTDDLKTTCGLDSTLHNALVCYVKTRIYEDNGSFQEAQYFKQMYDNKVKTHRSRKSGIRSLAVPKL